MPAFLAYKGRRHGSTDPTDAWWSYVTGFMWNSSRSEKWWWQCTVKLYINFRYLTTSIFRKVMVRQLLLAMVLGLIDFQSDLIPCLVLTIITLNLSLSALHWPHRDLYDNRLDFVLMLLALIGYLGNFTYIRPLIYCCCV
jgi:hypothetical protein